MTDSIQNILVQVSDFLWSYIIIAVLICCAVFFTWRTRFVQFRLIKEMVRLLLHPDKVQPDEIGHDELSMDVKVDGEMKHISSFQAFVVALASRIGTGNLAGVATAISIGSRILDVDAGSAGLRIGLHRIYACPTLQAQGQDFLLWWTSLLHEAWIGKGLDGHPLCHSDDHHLRFRLQFRAEQYHLPGMAEGIRHRACHHGHRAHGTHPAHHLRRYP